MPRSSGKIKLIPLGEVASCQYGLSLKADTCGNRPYIGMGQLVDGQVSLDGANRLTVDGAAAARYGLSIGDVLFNRTNSYDLVGKTAVVEDNGLVGAVFASYLVRFVFDKRPYNPRFLSVWMNTYQSIGNLKRIATPGVSQFNIRPSLLTERFLIPDVPCSYQDDVVRINNSCVDVTNTLRRRSVAAIDLKRGLAQQLLTGKKRFPAFGGDRWSEVRLGDVFGERAEQNRDDLPLLSVTGDRGIIPRDQLAKRDTSNADKSKYKRVAVGDIAYNTMRMWQGVSALSSLEGIVSPAYTVVVPTERIDGGFARHLFKFPPVVHLFHRHSQGLVDDTLNLKYKRFATIRLHIPASVEEQKKIAEVLDLCDTELALLDEQRQQYDLYKRGLMQRLLSGEIQVPA